MFGREPRGFWLPECGYSDGLDLLLQEANVRWTVLDTHGLLFAQPRPLRAIYAPCFTPAGPAVFARDRESNREVWSAESGYPGDPVYRDFYRDAGFDRSEEELRSFLQPPGVRKFTGLKYHRVTGRTDEKELYHPAWALAAADEHADDFFAKRQARLPRTARARIWSPLIVSPFDAELFGHWWFEGPRFLESFLRRAAREREDFQLTTPTEFLAAHPSQQIVRPNPSSWGEDGFNSVWLDEASRLDLSAPPRRHPAHDGNRAPASRHRRSRDRARAAAGRARTPPRAIERLGLPHQNRKRARVCEAADARITSPAFAGSPTDLEAGRVDREFLGECEERANLFPDLNWRYYL